MAILASAEDIRPHHAHPTLAEAIETLAVAGGRCSSARRLLARHLQSGSELAIRMRFPIVQLRTTGLPPRRKSCLNASGRVRDFRRRGDGRARDAPSASVISRTSWGSKKGAFSTWRFPAFCTFPRIVPHRAPPACRQRHFPTSHGRGAVPRRLGGAPFNLARIRRVGRPWRPSLPSENWNRRVAACARRDDSRPADLMQSQSLASFFASIRGQWLDDDSPAAADDLFPADRQLADPRQVFAYECLLHDVQQTAKSSRRRIPENGYVARPAQRARSFGEDDAHRLRRAHRQGRDFFINFNPAATQDLDRCLDCTFQAVLASNVRLRGSC